MRKLYLIPVLLSVLLSCQNKNTRQKPCRPNAIMLADSVFKNDELSKKWISAVQGIWDSDMTCSDSDCGLYTVGDRRNEKWEFTTDSVRVYTMVMKKKKLLSVFKAMYAGDTIMLESATDSPFGNGLKIKVVLDSINVNAIKGTQTITAEGYCKSVFLVALTREEI